MAGGKTQECPRPARPSDVLRAGTARAPARGRSESAAPIARTSRMEPPPLPGTAMLLRSGTDRAPVEVSKCTQKSLCEKRRLVVGDEVTSLEYLQKAPICRAQ